MSEQLPCSVEVDLPTEVEAIIAAHEAPDEGEVWTTVIHGALWEMRGRAMGAEAVNRELHDEISEGLASVDRGEGVEATPEWWKQFRIRCEENHRRIEIARKEGLVGNLLLPEKLHAFVMAEIAAGRFASASELVSAAVRKCSWHWERDDAAG